MDYKYMRINELIYKSIVFTGGQSRFLAVESSIQYQGTCNKWTCNLPGKRVPNPYSTFYSFSKI